MSYLCVATTLVNSSLNQNKLVLGLKMAGDGLTKLRESVASQASVMAALQANLNEFMENINSKFAAVIKGIEDLGADVTLIKSAIMATEEIIRF